MLCPVLVLMCMVMVMVCPALLLMLMKKDDTLLCAAAALLCVAAHALDDNEDSLPCAVAHALDDDDDGALFLQYKNDHVLPCNVAHAHDDHALPLLLLHVMMSSCGSSSPCAIHTLISSSIIVNMCKLMKGATWTSAERIIC